jgi:hypothetical protein
LGQRNEKLLLPTPPLVWAFAEEKKMWTRISGKPGIRKLVDWQGYMPASGRIQNMTANFPNSVIVKIGAGVAQKPLPFRSMRI